MTSAINHLRKFINFQHFLHNKQVDKGKDKGYLQAKLVRVKKGTKTDLAS